MTGNSVSPFPPAPQLLTENMYSYNSSKPRSALPILEQPKQRKERRRSRIVSEVDPLDLRGLSSLAVADSISIEIDKKCCRLGWDVHYSLSNTETESVIYRATEDHHWCYCGDLKNVVVRDHSENPVARICYKEKFCSTKMVLAVYAPPDLLVGSVEESSSCFQSAVEFKIRNADGQPLFYIEYKQSSGLRICNPCFEAYFTVKSGDKSTEVAKITEKTNQALRLQFKSKLDITGKTILTGFCIGLIHKAYNQPVEAPPLKS